MAPYVAVGVALGFLLVSVAVILCHCRRRRRRGGERGKTRRNVLEDTGTLEDSFQLSDWRPVSNSSPLLKAHNHAYTDWIQSFLEESGLQPISAQDLSLLRPLGEGAFGKVFLVQYNKDAAVNYTTIFPDDESIEKAQESTSNDYVNSVSLPREMAMKQLKRISSDKIEDLKREAGVMVSLAHPNIVSFYGVCLSPSLSLLYEFMEKGDLVTYLREHNPDLVNFEKTGVQPLRLLDLVNMAGQVAAGLEYLAARRLVHRDLAARNCLVSQDDVVKISDFGMTRNVGHANDYYRMGGETMVPLRWLPPESIIYRKFTTESDMWSFGILLWEIFSFGQIPWSQYSNDEVMEIVREGRHQARPKTCPPVVYERLILPCWHLVSPQPLSATPGTPGIGRELKMPSERMGAAEAVAAVAALGEEARGYCTLAPLPTPTSPTPTSTLLSPTSTIHTPTSPPPLPSPYLPPPNPPSLHTDHCP